MTELKRVTELVIDRTKWARGDCADCNSRGIGDYSDRALLDCEGGMCCLGFLAEASGEDSLLGEGFPSDEVAVLYGLIPEDDFDTAMWDEFVTVNDDASMEVTDKSRESKIKKLFKEKLGVKVTFKGTTPRPRRDEDKEYSPDW